jgi:hypothetical protein
MVAPRRPGGAEARAGSAGFPKGSRRPTRQVEGQAACHVPDAAQADHLVRPRCSHRPRPPRYLQGEALQHRHQPVQAALSPSRLPNREAQDRARLEGQWWLGQKSREAQDRSPRRDARSRPARPGPCPRGSPGEAEPDAPVLAAGSHSGWTGTLTRHTRGKSPAPPEPDPARACSETHATFAADISSWTPSKQISCRRAEFAGGAFVAPSSSNRHQPATPQRPLLPGRHKVGLRPPSCARR